MRAIGQPARRARRQGRADDAALVHTQFSCNRRIRWRSRERPPSSRGRVRKTASAPNARGRSPRAAATWWSTTRATRPAARRWRRWRAAWASIRSPCRLTCPRTTDCKRLVQAAVDRWGQLDVLVNNAAVTKPIPHKRMDLLNDDEFERIFSVNVIGNYQMCRAAAPHLKATGDAAIVNISSMGALRAGGVVDGLHRLEGGAEQPHDRRWRARSRRRCASTRSARAACSAPGRARSSPRSNTRSALTARRPNFRCSARIMPDDVAVAALFLVAGCDRDDRRSAPHGLRAASGRDQRQELTHSDSGPVVPAYVGMTHTPTLPRFLRPSAACTPSAAA